MRRILYLSLIILISLTTILEGRIYRDTEVYEILEDYDIESVMKSSKIGYVSNSKYYHSISERMLELCRAEHRKMLSAWCIDGWRKSYDCVDWSESYVVVMELLYSSNVGDDVLAGDLAIGICKYLVGGKSPHAIVMYIDSDGEIGWYDPQIGELIELSDEELDSIVSIDI